MEPLDFEITMLTPKCSAVTACIWWHNPADVVMAEIIHINMDTDKILEDARIPLEKQDDWRMTPLDFASREEWWWSKVWWKFLATLRRIYIRYGSGGRPTDRIVLCKTLSSRISELHLIKNPSLPPKFRVPVYDAEEGSLGDLLARCSMNNAVI